MTLVKMQKIELAGLLAEEEQILELLKKEGLLEIRSSKIKREVPSLENQETQIAHIRSAISFIEKFSKTKKGLMESLIPPKFDLNKEKLNKACREFDCQGLLHQIRDLDQEINNIHSLKNNLLQNYNALHPFKKLSLPLNRLHENNKINVMAGSIRIKEHQKFEIDLRAQTPYLETEVVDFIKGEAYIAIYYLIGEKEKIDRFISSSNFTPIKLLYSKSAPAEELNILKQQIENANLSEIFFIKEAAELKKYKYALMLLHDLLLEKQQNYNAKNKAAATGYTFVIEGWLKALDLPKLKSRLPKTIAIFEIEADKDEKVPSAIENYPLLSPYELIVSLFGSPSQEELEPTALLAPFFLLFFGICLSDTGYGVLLVLLCLWLLKNLKLPSGGKKLVLLLLQGGIITIPIGIISGAYFGLPPEYLPFGLAALKHLQLINPITNPLLMMVISLALGIVQIIFGLILDAVKKIKNKDVFGALLDNLPWILFLLSLVSLFVVRSYNGYLAVLLAATLIITQGRSEKNIFQKLIRGILSLYSTSAYLGDTLSYSRLLALMMSTSIIGMVINILAGMVKDSVPILGYVLMIIVLIIGHTFNLVISTLGAFIHSMRLQMVEFFSKFYSDGGTEFRPFRHNTKYVNIIE